MTYADKIVELTAGPNRIESVEAAKSRAALQRARTSAEIDRIRVDTANYVLANEMRKTINREAIVEEAFNALPPPNMPVSEVPISEDFLPNIFDKFDGISDPDVHKIVCRFTWFIAGNSVPLVFDLSHSFYKDAGLSFNAIRNLESLGLITLQAVGNYTLTMNSQGSFFLTYNNTLMTAKIPDSRTISIGKIMFTAAGLELHPLVSTAPAQGFEEYVTEQYKGNGIAIEVFHTQKVT